MIQSTGPWLKLLIILAMSWVNAPLQEFVESTQIEQALIEIGVDYAQEHIVQRPQLFTFDSLLKRPVRSRSLTLKLPGTLR